MYLLTIIITCTVLTIVHKTQQRMYLQYKDQGILLSKIVSTVLLTVKGSVGFRYTFTEQWIHQAAILKALHNF